MRAAPTLLLRPPPGNGAKKTNTSLARNEHCSHYPAARGSRARKTFTLHPSSRGKFELLLAMHTHLRSEFADFVLVLTYRVNPSFYNNGSFPI